MSRIKQALAICATIAAISSVSAIAGTEPSSKIGSVDVVDAAASTLEAALLPYHAKAEHFGVSPTVRDVSPKRHPTLTHDAQVSTPANASGIVTEARAVARAMGEAAPAVGSAKSIHSMPLPEFTFEGINSVAHETVYGDFLVSAADAQGDVGPNHYVSVGNGPIGIYSKVTGALLAPLFSINDLFPNLAVDHPCRNAHGRDQTVIHDNLADRWIISQLAVLAVETVEWFECVAISQTGDPTGAYFTYVFRLPTNAGNPHFLRWGAWTDAYYQTLLHGNSFAAPPHANGLGTGFFAFDRARMLVGDPDAGYVYFDHPTPGEGGILPSDIEGIRAPPAASSQVLMRYTASEFGAPFTDAIVPYTFVPDFETPEASTLTVGSPIPVQPFDGRRPWAVTESKIERRIGDTSREALNDVATFGVSYHNLGTQAAPINSYTMSWGVNVNVAVAGDLGSAQFASAVRWTELRRDGAGAFVVRDQGTHANVDTNGASGPDYFLPHIAQDHQGNIAVGFATTGPLQLPSIRWAGRTGSAATGTLNQGESLMFAGGGSELRLTDFGKVGSMNIDPFDSCTFYYQNLYRLPENNGVSSRWNSRVGRFKFPECVPAAKVQLNVDVNVCASGTPVSGALVTATGGYAQPTDAAGSASLTLAPGSYSVAAALPGAASTQSSVVLTNGGTASANLCLSGAPVLAAESSNVLAESFTPFNQAPDPAEMVTVQLCLSNVGLNSTANLVGTLAASGNVIAPSGPQNYGMVHRGGAPVCRPFTFSINPVLTCGDHVTAALQLADGASNLGSVAFVLDTGELTGGGLQTVSYAGAPVTIPDNVPAGISVPLPVNGIPGRIVDLDVNFDASGTTSCADAAVAHTFIGDLVLRLISPSGTEQALLIQRGGGRNNICATVFDDDAALVAANAISANSSSSLFGRFRAEGPLTVFDGAAANGTWQLKVADVEANDIGTVKHFALAITNEIRSCGFAGNPQLFLSGFE